MNKIDERVSKEEPKNQEETAFDKSKECGKKKKGKLIVVVLGIATILALGNFAAQHDIDPDNGKIDIVIPGAEEPIQIPDIGGAIGDVIEEIPIIGDLVKGDPFKDQPYYDEKPTLRSDEEIAKTGASFEDVEKKLTNLVWQFAELKYKDTTLQQTDRFSIKFLQIEQFDPYRDIHNLENYDDRLFFGMHPDGLDTYQLWVGDMHIDNAYGVDIYASVKFYGAFAGKELVMCISNLAVEKDVFEKAAHILTNGKMVATEDYLFELPTDYRILFNPYINQEVFKGKPSTLKDFEQLNNSDDYQLILDVLSSIENLNIKEPLNQ